ncbi:MAG: hypothetical protein EOO11_02340, partial [Chitinophagaceae bacterium]
MFQRKGFLFVLAFLLAGLSAYSQSVSGRLLDPESRAPLPGASVALSSIRDTSVVAQTVTTDSAGRFRFALEGRDSVRLRFYYVGYEVLQRTESRPSRAKRKRPAESVVTVWATT